MKILVASDSFKGTISSFEVGDIIKTSLGKHHPIEVLAISDGGEGLIEALSPVIEGHKVEVDIHDPLRRQVKGHYYLSQDRQTAIIESAIACGLYHLEENERNPLETTTYGVGELIRHAIQEGAKKLVIGIGGSSTNDAGIGLLEALGVKFFDIENNELSNLRGADLIKIFRIDISELNELLRSVRIEVACDVDNVLLGAQGASYTFGPQKGATESMCNFLEEGVSSFVEVVENTIHKSIRNISGAGAAGGMGMCLNAFLDAELKRGIELILDAVNFDHLIETVDLVITGEGKIDNQTAHGKVIEGISKRCRLKDKKVYAVCALNDADDDVSILFDDVFAIVPLIASKEEALESPHKFLRQLVEKHIARKLFDRVVE